ncbi:uncharacterized protein LOC103577789 [Microplitis demolitor]|uniref:uncharacterized protein LOC103577789 n=1 Tax=Microplitis demolitor TaxID=69319 RepID=UPI0004CDC1A0|nr:uncharacterized protein LOC103577789 [Microplitis demolitor]
MRSTYSMLKSTLKINNNINIEAYNKLRTFLKKLGTNLRNKKSKVLSSEDITKFIKTAADEIYLVDKVILIFGICGACRRAELCSLTTENIQEKTSFLLVEIFATKTSTMRQFIIDGDFYKIVKKYMDLRPQLSISKRFFLNFQKGKCTNQPIGLNKIGGVPKKIASYLKLPDASQYTGHCSRRTSATSLVDGGDDVTSLKRLGSWKSTAFAESYIDHSITNKHNAFDQITKSIVLTSSKEISSKSQQNNNNTTTVNYNALNPSTSTTVQQLNNRNPLSSMNLTINNFTNITINYNTYTKNL